MWNGLATVASKWQSLFRLPATADTFDATEERAGNGVHPLNYMRYTKCIHSLNVWYTNHALLSVHSVCPNEKQ